MESTSVYTSLKAALISKLLLVNQEVLHLELQLGSLRSHIAYSIVDLLWTNDPQQFASVRNSTIQKAWCSLDPAHKYSTTFSAIVTISSRAYRVPRPKVGSFLLLSRQPINDHRWIQPGNQYQKQDFVSKIQHQYELFDARLSHSVANPKSKPIWLSRWRRRTS